MRTKTSFVDTLRRTTEPVLRRLLHSYWRFSRGLTLGVRGLAIDGENRVFLIRHSYVNGWHLPGGGVETGETLREALAREMKEEGNIEIGQPAELFGFYFNARASRRDHVALFVIRQFSQPAPPQPNSEIIDHGFFAPHALPDGTTASTRARLREVLENALAPERW